MQLARVELEEAREGAGQVQPARVELEEAREGARQEKDDRTAIKIKIKIKGFFIVKAHR